jgi:hypothetical protein
MQSITITDMIDVVEHLAVRLDEPVMLWGPPGCGKTEGVYQAGQKLGAVICDVRLGQYDSVDIRGIPGVEKKSGQTVWHPPSTLPFKGNSNFPTDRTIILMLDELTSAVNAVFGVCYQLINERRVGEHELMPNVRIVCAGNRDGDRGVTNKMPLPLCNRLTHFEVLPDPDGWCLYAQSQGWAPEAIAFIQFRKPLLFTFDPKKPEKAFATPRTWEKAIRYHMDDKLPQRAKTSAMCGAVGDGPAMEFIGFIDIYQSITPMSEILRKPATARVPGETEASMQYATAIAVSGEMSLKTIAPLHTYLNRMPPEFVVLAWRLAIARDGGLTSAPEFLDLAVKYKAIW